MNKDVLERKKADVKKYYGEILKTSQDLKTSACCSLESFPEHIRAILQNIEPEILEKFYGCGSPLPNELEGRTVLDLGCGSGRDVYVASCLVGETGKAIGIDMTDEQLAVARRHRDAQMKRFGFQVPNVDFRKGYIEDLAEAGIEDNSVDVVISNCVINLSPDKRRVFQEIFRVLKPGGELYFADVFADARVPAEFHDDPLAYGECLGGAMYIEDFRRLLEELGCPDYRVAGKREIRIDDPVLARKAGAIRFDSMTIRAFKLAGLEDRCEDFGQVARYLGTMEDCPVRFRLDDHHEFITGKPLLVCGNTASMLTETRFGKHFCVTGDRSRHFGLFSCGPDLEPNAFSGNCC